MSKYTVIRDTQEKSNGNRWNFIRSDYCDGMIEQHMKTGDYTLIGYEDIFVIERKASVGEFYQNLCTADFSRFSRELDRLQEIPHSYIVCEFNFAALTSFPRGSGLPANVQRKLSGKSSFLIRRFLEVQTKYRIPILFAGSPEQAKTLVNSLFKRIIENVDSTI